MRKARGVYLLELFDDYGSKVKSKKVKAGNYMTGKKKADKWCAKHAGYSAVLLLVVFNSKDNKESWDVK